MPEGTSYHPTPLDFAILEKLPDKGIIGGLRWAGRPAKYVRQDVNEGVEQAYQVATSEVQARMRAMHVAGLIEPFGSGNTRVWARTPDGKSFLARKEEVLGL